MPLDPDDINDLKKISALGVQRLTELKNTLDEEISILTEDYMDYQELLSHESELTSNKIINLNIYKRRYHNINDLFNNIKQLQQMIIDISKKLGLPQKPEESTSKQSLKGVEIFAEYEKKIAKELLVDKEPPIMGNDSYLLSNINIKRPDSLPEKVETKHLGDIVNFRFYTADQMSKITKAFQKSIEAGTLINKIRRTRGRHKSENKDKFEQLTELERELDLPFSVIFAQDKAGNIVPITLYIGDDAHSLGSGTDATVKIGYDEENRCWVAVKIQEIPASRIEQRSSIAEEQQTLESRNLLRAHIERSKDDYIKIYSVQDILGKDLSFYTSIEETTQAQKPGDLITDFSEKLNIAIQMAKELDTIHKDGILHCDIKSSNFMYNKETKVVKLIDFGRMLKINPDQETVYNHIKRGSPGYFAPEISTAMMKNDKPIYPYSKESDIYSLGIAYTSLFKSGGYSNTIPTEYQKAVQKILIQLNCENPKERLSTQELISNLERIKNEYEESHKVKNRP